MRGILKKMERCLPSRKCEIESYDEYDALEEDGKRIS